HERTSKARIIHQIQLIRGTPPAEMPFMHDDDAIAHA
ncbi:glutamate decarboxylase, partial [Shigella dysenteriae]